MPAPISHMQLTDLQALLVRRGIVTREQIRHAVAATHDSGTTWIEYLVLARAVDEQAFARCIVEGAKVPACDGTSLARIPPDVVELVPADLAVEHRVVPVRLEMDGDLTVAMVDPTDLAAVEEVGFFLGRRLLRMVATASAIAWALHAYYRATSALFPAQRAAAAAPTRRRSAASITAG